MVEQGRQQKEAQAKGPGQEGTAEEVNGGLSDTEGDMNSTRATTSTRSSVSQKLRLTTRMLVFMASQKLRPRSAISARAQV